MNSVLRRRVFKSLTPCFSSPFSSSVRSLLNARLNESSMKDAIRFENQNKTWTYKEIETHSDAFAYGLLELGYKKGDRVLLWVDRAFTSEITIAQLGMAKVGVAFVPLVSSTAGDFEKALKDSDCKGVVFSPNTKHDGKKRVETINQIFPQLETAYSGQQNTFSNYPNLKHLIHVGFNTIPGTIKYRQLLVYANPNFNTNKLPTELDGSVPLIYGQHQGSYKEYTVRDINDFAENFRSQNNVERGDFIGVAGCPYCPGTFAAGAYQSLAFGNYTILYGNENFKNLVQKVQIQHPSHLIIHEKFNSADLSTTVDHESLNRLKKVFVSSKDEGSYSNLFGGKVSGFNAYW